LLLLELLHLLVLQPANSSVILNSHYAFGAKPAA
jgi:hypothetical protein